jgi:hypothetical protein
MAISAETSKSLPTAAAIYVVKVKDANICVPAMFAAVTLTPRCAQRSRTVATTKVAVCPCVEPSDYYPLGWLKEGLGLLEPIAWKIDWAIREVQIP